MAEYGSGSPPEGDSANQLGADGKPRLTEEEKKQNHIASGICHPLFTVPFHKNGIGR